MKEKLSSYLIPDNPIALAIVIVLGVLFALWTILLLIRWVVLSKRHAQLRACADVSSLEEIIRKKATLGNATIGELSALKQEADVTFREYCRANKLKERSIIAQHIRAIFDSGMNESRLEVASLVKNTASYLLRSTTLLRSVLSLFIIIGLLGTLGGLASTLGQLSQISPDGAESVSPAPVTTQQPIPADRTNGDTQQRAASGLRTVLQQLKFAFAPSMWGVSYTIIGVLLFGLFVQVSGTPLRDALERHTLVDWVPALIPTPSQSLWEKLQVSERQIQASLESAQDVAKLAKSIQDDSSDLSKSIKDAKKTIPQLTRASDQLVNFSDRFATAVDSLTPFQQQLRELYEQMLTESKTFHATVKDNIDRGELFQQGVTKQLDAQNNQIVALLNAFNAYEQAYLKTREQIDENLDVLLQEARKAYFSLGERNQDVINSMVAGLRDPLAHDLSEGLSKVQGSLDVRLEKVSKTLEELHAPLDRAAGGLEGTIANLNTRTETLLKEVQQEFFKRNELQQQHVTGIQNLAKELPPVLDQLSKSNKLMTEYEQVLGKNVTTLAQHVGSLGGNIDVLNQSLSANGKPSDKNSNPNSNAQLKQLIGLHEQLVNELRSLLETLRRRPAVASVNTAQARPTVFQEQLPIREGFFRRVGRRMAFWRR